VNEIGYDSGNASITSGRDLPWLQDVPGTDVWNQWAVGFRDVIILDENNVHVDTFNLTTYDLSDSVNYEALLQLLVDTASP